MKQHTLPVKITDGKIEYLSKVSLGSREYDEAWVQDICYTNPGILPIAEIEQTFRDMSPICKELGSPSGSMDLVFVNEYGFIAIGECKLWRNPEARRKVIAQILEYAKDLSKWSYEQFERACLKARKDENATSLYEIVSQQDSELDQASFIDAVQRNLERGRFVLMVIGDGIRESMEELSDFLQRYGNLQFTLALVELPIFKIPASEELIITPRIIAKTKEIERIIYRISEGHHEAGHEKQEKTESRTISEKVFFERLEQNIGTTLTQKVQRFIQRLDDELGIKGTLGRGKKLSLNLKTAGDLYNFASLQESGEVYFFGIVERSAELGHKEIGMEYLQKLALLVAGFVDDTTNIFSWSVRQKNRKYFPIQTYLEHEEAWVSLIAETIMRFREAEQD